MIGYVIWGEEEAKKWYNGHMNSKEASEYLGISRYMLRRLVNENKIPYTKHYQNISFHQTILDAWMRGEFIPGRVELILDEESIEFDHRDALREHYERYPELLEKVKEQVELSIPSVETNYKFEVRQDGILVSYGSVNSKMAFQVFLSNVVVDELFEFVQKMKSSR